MSMPLALGSTPSPTPLLRALPVAPAGTWPRAICARRRVGLSAGPGVDIDRVVGPTCGVERVAVRRKDEAHVGVHLLDHLHEHRRGLIGPTHVVQEDVLGRVGGVYRTSALVERVLASSDDRQRRAVRAELRAHRLAGDEVRVAGQAEVPGKLQKRALDKSGRDELAGRQPPNALVVLSIVVVAVAPPIVIGVVAPPVVVGVFAPSIVGVCA